MEGHSGSVRGIDLSPQGRVATASNDKIIKIWERGICEKTYRSEEKVKCVKFHPDPTIQLVASGGNDKNISIWQLDTDSEIPMKTLKGHTGQVWALEWTGSSEIVSGSLDKTLKVWDTDTGECKRTMEGHKGSVAALAQNAKDNTVISGSWDE